MSRPDNGCHGTQGRFFSEPCFSWLRALICLRAALAMSILFCQCYLSLSVWEWQVVFSSQAINISHDLLCSYVWKHIAGYLPISRCQFCLSLPVLHLKYHYVTTGGVIIIFPTPLLSIARIASKVPLCNYRWRHYYLSDSPSIIARIASKVPLCNYRWRHYYLSDSPCR